MLIQVTCRHIPRPLHLSFCLVASYRSRCSWRSISLHHWPRQDRYALPLANGRTHPQNRPVPKTVAQILTSKILMLDSLSLISLVWLYHLHCKNEKGAQLPFLLQTLSLRTVSGSPLEPLFRLWQVEAADQHTVWRKEIRASFTVSWSTLSFKPSSRYFIPLVLKKDLIGRPDAAIQSCNSG